jgi:hypothetical protein
VSELRPLSPEQEERLARYRAGAMAPEARAAFEHEALADEALAEALYAEVELDAVRLATAPASPRTIVLEPRRSWFVLRALPVAAALAAVAFAGWWLTRTPAGPAGPDVLRGGSSAPQLIEPVGDVTALPAELRWNAVAGADHYRVELFDATGRRLGTAVTPETTLAIERLVTGPFGAGEWRVVPIAASGREGEPLPRAAFRTRPQR